MCEKHTTHTLMYETTQREERGGGVIGLHGHYAIHPGKRRMHSEASTHLRVLWGEDLLSHVRVPLVLKVEKQRLKVQTVANRILGILYKHAGIHKNHAR